MARILSLTCPVCGVAKDFLEIFIGESEVNGHHTVKLYRCPTCHVVITPSQEVVENMGILRRKKKAKDVLDDLEAMLVTESLRLDRKRRQNYIQQEGKLEKPFPRH